MSVHLVAAVQYIVHEAVLWLLMAAMIAVVCGIWWLPTMRGLFVGLGLVDFGVYEMLRKRWA